MAQGEEIIWQGHPVGGVSFKPAYIFTTVFGLFFAGFALFWMIMAAQAGGMFWAFGLIHFSVGIGIMLGPFVFLPYRNRHTWYSLSDHRAFIATDLPIQGRRA